MTQARDIVGISAEPSFAADSNLTNTSSVHVVSSEHIPMENSASRHSRTRGLSHSRSVLLSKQKSRTLDWELLDDRAAPTEQKETEKAKTSTWTCVVS